VTIEELHGIVVEGFRAVDDRFARIDDRFDEIRQEMREFRVAIETRIHGQEETTRRHFDVMVERVEAAVRIVAEGRSDARRQDRKVPNLGGRGLADRQRDL
jgi:hypothetical protein